MSRFGPDPRAFFNLIYQAVPPWDIDGPQPALSALIADYPPPNPILDVGCGSGDLAIHLAQLGHQVMGVDFVEAAIDQARQKARALPTEVAGLLEFQAADAFQPSLLQQEFGSVVDSGFMHLFDPAQCDRFIDDIARTLAPGGRYYLLAFNIDFAIPNVPRQISAEEVRSHFTHEKGWRILDIRSVEFLSRVAPAVPATGACIERLPADGA
ncbi:MAG: class I SAM-dependent methyltransferase [Chloroflexota bacterium]